MENNKTTKKTMVEEALKEMKISKNPETGYYEVSQKKLDEIWENEKFNGFKFIHSKKDSNLHAIGSLDGKTKYAVILKVSKTKKEKVEKTETKEKLTKKENVGGKGSKAKGNSYIIMLKKYDEKKEEKITDFTTCTEVKAWLKTISKKQLEYLKIYDANMNECRKSAWVIR